MPSDRGIGNVTILIIKMIIIIKWKFISEELYGERLLLMGGTV